MVGFCRPSGRAGGAVGPCPEGRPQQPITSRVSSCLCSRTTSSLSCRHVPTGPRLWQEGLAGVSPTGQVRMPRAYRSASSSATSLCESSDPIRFASLLSTPSSANRSWPRTCPETLLTTERDLARDAADRLGHGAIVTSVRTRTASVRETITRASARGTREVRPEHVPALHPLTTPARSRAGALPRLRAPRDRPNPSVGVRISNVGLRLVEGIEPEVDGPTDQVAAARVERAGEPVEPLHDPVVELDEPLFPGHDLDHSIWSSI